MKHLKTNRPLKRDKGLRKKIFLGMVATAYVIGTQAQNTSYYPNNQGIGGGWSSAFGDFALFSNSGFDNAASGVFSLHNNTGGSFNTGMGFRSGFTNFTGNHNTGCGSHALENNQVSYNTAHGSFALNINVNGGYNTSSGAYSMYNNKDASYNTASGAYAMYNNGANPAAGGAFENTANGAYAMFTNQTGKRNNAVGYNALYSNTDGESNTADGWQSLYSNNGDHNTAMGFFSLANNLTGNENTAVGSSALSANTPGDRNTAVGIRSLEWVNGTDNTACGSDAGGALGFFGGPADGNTALGALTLIGITTGDYNTAVGYGANVANGVKRASAIGYNAFSGVNDRVTLGDMGAGTQVWGQGFIAPSDQRFKSSVKEEDVKGLAFIKLLRPVVYNFEGKKFTEHVMKNMPDSIRKRYLSEDFSKGTAVRQSGFLAQEVEEAARKSGYDFNGLHKPEGETDTYGISYATFVVPLVKGMQEQQAMIEDQAKTNEELKKQIADLQKQVDALTKTGSTTGINQLDNPATGFVMDQNIPNPFSHETTIKYTLTEQTQSAVLNVYDLTGKQITSFPLTQKGASSITITSEKLAAGIYIYSIVADGRIMDSKRMVVAEK